MCTFGTRTSTNYKKWQLTEPSVVSQPPVSDCKKQHLTDPSVENHPSVSDSAAW